MFYYHLDLVEVVRRVLEYEVRASFVLALIQRLPEGSMFLARRRGGEERWQEFFEWTRQQAILADLFDAMQIQTQVTGNWSKKAPDMPMYPRPKVVEKKKPITVADLYAAWSGKVARSNGAGVQLD